MPNGRGLPFDGKGIVKISKATRWILTVGILAILLIGVGVVYGHQMAEHRQLKSDIAKSQQELTLYTKEKGSLETRLNQARSQLSSYQANFHEPTESVEINEALFDTADGTNVQITSLSSSAPASEKVNGVNYKVFSLSLTVEGDNLPELLVFTNKLSEVFPDSSISSVSISVSGVTSTMSLSMKVYAYED